MKRISIILFVFCCINQLSCQTGNIDTLFIVNNNFNSIQNIKYSKMCFVMFNDVIILQEKDINKKNKCNDSLSDLISRNYQSYFKFYFKNKKIIEEGNWSEVYFRGYYRSYFKNGQIKAEGNYASNVEVGKWVYYKKNGQVYKIINYPNSIIGEYDRDQAKIDIETQLSLYKYDFVTLQDSINFVKSVKSRWLRRYR